MKPLATLLITLLPHLLSAQAYPDLMVLKSGDSIVCDVVKLDYTFITIHFDKNGKQKRSSYPTGRVKLIYSDYGTENQRVTFGATSIVKKQTTTEPGSVVITGLQTPSEHLRLAGRDGIIGLGFGIGGLALSGILAASGTTQDLPLVVGAAGAVVSIGFTFSAFSHIKSAGIKMNTR